MADKEFAFDVKLWTTCRVKAADEKAARKIMLERLNCIDIGFTDVDGLSLTEASIEDDSGEDSELVEIDGEAV